MPLILSWETPTAIWEGQCRNAELWRNAPGHSSSSIMLVRSDIPWGTCLDTETSDITSVYEIRYTSPAGALVTVLDSEIRRWVPDADTVQVNWAMRREDGSPWACRSIEISDDYAGGLGRNVRRLNTNYAGKALSFHVQNVRVLVRLEDDPYAYDLVIPETREITGAALLASATRLPTDRRGWF